MERYPFESRRPFESKLGMTQDGKCIEGEGEISSGEMSLAETAAWGCAAGRREELTRGGKVQTGSVLDLVHGNHVVVK
jgi:hypothetical protein